MNWTQGVRGAGDGALLTTVIDTVVDGIIIVDRRGVIRVFNPAAENLFGYTADEVIGSNISMLMPAGDAERHDGFMDAYRQTGRKRIIGIGREVKGQRKDGSVFPMSLAIGEIGSGSTAGGELAYVGIVRDVTEQKKTYAALTEARMKAELASNAKSEFLSRMSHELRTPMNAIMGFAQLLQMAPDDLPPAQRADYLQSILAPARHLAALIDDILDIGRIETGQLHVSLHSLDLAATLADAIAIARPMAARCGIRIVVDRTATVPGIAVLADPVRLTQCVVNLLTNGIKYNRPDGEIRISVAAPEGGGQVRLTVRDTGIGIPEDRLGELFMPFQRLHPAREEIEGAGIGLALTRQLIEAMRGGIAVETRVNVGSSFHIDLRSAGTAPIERPQPRRQQHGAWPAAIHRPQDGRKLALYVEDNPVNVDLMRSVFSGLSATELMVAYTGETGLAIAESEPVGLVILDINLPGMDGFETMSRLRRGSRTAALPVIGLSSRATERDLDRAAQLGFYRYFVKPMNVPEFMASVRSVL